MIKCSTSTGIGLLGYAKGAPAAPWERCRPFCHGVASGDPLPDRVVLWTRISGVSSEREIKVAYQVARDPLMQDLIVEGEARTGPLQDYTLKVDPLLPEEGTYYYYQFIFENHKSPIGRTKTATIDSEKICLAVTSCSSIWSGFMNGYDRLSERNDLDLVIHCGDYVYDFADEEEQLVMFQKDIDHIPPKDLDSVRRRHQLYHLNPALQEVHRQHPFSIIWDNHDLGTEGEIEEALKAFHDWTPTRSPKPTKPEYLYRRLSLGPLCEVFLLDTRYIGRGPPIGEGASLLGEEQFQWLINGLKESKARWKIIANQVMIAPLTAFGRPLSKSLWDGYPSERKRLYEAIQDHSLDNVVFVTGDAHMSFASDLWHRGERVANEFLPSSISRGNFNETIRGFFSGAIGSGFEKIIRVMNPHFRYFNAIDHGYGLLHLDDDKAQFEFWYTPIKEPSSKQDCGKIMQIASGSKTFHSRWRVPAILPRTHALPAPKPEPYFHKTPLACKEKPQGSYFHDGQIPETIGGAKKITLTFDPYLSLRTTHSPDVTLTHGPMTGREVSISLLPGEYVKKVVISFARSREGAKIVGLCYETSLERRLEAGKKTRHQETLHLPGRQVLMGHYGYKNPHLTALGLLSIPA